jgi:hypothetical protein
VSLSCRLVDLRGDICGTASRNSLSLHVPPKALLTSATPSRDAPHRRKEKMKKDKTIGTLPSLMSASAEAVPAIFKGMEPGPGEQQVGARASACFILCQRRQRPAQACLLGQEHYQRCHATSVSNTAALGTLPAFGTVASVSNVAGVLNVAGR